MRLLDDGSDVTRLGFAIPRAVGSAVTRNRVRRRLRHILADLDAHGPTLPAGALLVAAHPGAGSSGSKELRGFILHMLDQLAASPRRTR